jgi:hypothetical protein
MTAPIQFIVLKYKGKWSIRSRDLQRSFSMQREAMDAAIQLANETGKDGKPAVVLFQKSKTEFQKIWTYGESLLQIMRTGELNETVSVESDLPKTSGTPEPEKLPDNLG